MADIHIQSVCSPFDIPDVAHQAVTALTRADAMGLIPHGETIDRLDARTLKSIVKHISRAASAGDSSRIFPAPPFRLRNTFPRCSEKSTTPSMRLRCLPANGPDWGESWVPTCSPGFWESPFRACAVISRAPAPLLTRSPHGSISWRWSPPIWLGAYNDGRYPPLVRAASQAAQEPCPRPASGAGVAARRPGAAAGAGSCPGSGLVAGHMIGFRHTDPRYPFLWEHLHQPAARWHAESEAPAHYFSNTPDGAWAEFLRHEEITDPEDLPGIRRALWAIDIGEVPPASPDLPPEILTGGPETWRACREEARRLRAGGSTGFTVPSRPPCCRARPGAGGWTAACNLAPTGTARSSSSSGDARIWWAGRQRLPDARAGISCVG